VEVTLLDEHGEPVHMLVRFSANLSVASEVAYDTPQPTPELLEGVCTVDDALDRLYDIKVNKAGDTMTGPLTIGGDLTVDGNIGIGTGEPEAKLDVRGKLRVDGNRIIIGGYDGADFHWIRARSNDPDGVFLGFVSSDGYKADRVEISPGGKLGLLVDTSGNVGIGEAPNARYRLDVAGVIKATSFEGDGSRLTGIGTGNWFEGRKGDIYFIGNRVGIGTRNPLTRLHITGDEDVGDEDLGFRVRGHGCLMIGRVSARNLVLDDNELMARNDGKDSPLHLQADGGDLVVHYHQEGRDARRRFVIKHSGDVGIGVKNPVAKLDVAGTVRATVFLGNYGTGSTDYAEYFESQNGKAIPVGVAVVLENGKARRSKKNETPIGVISANPGVVGGVHIEWPKKYLRDEFGDVIVEEYQEEVMVPKTKTVTRERQKMEAKTFAEEVTSTQIVLEGDKYIQKEIVETLTREVEEPLFHEVDLYDETGENVIGKHRIPVMETYEEEVEVLDENGQPVFVGSGECVTRRRPRLNPEYDESQEYLPREQRPEWNCVGLLGQLPLRKGQPVAESWIKIKDISDEVELWLVR
jgi:hypothetical protein